MYFIISYIKLCCHSVAYNKSAGLPDRVGYFKPYQLFSALRFHYIYLFHALQVYQSNNVSNSTVTSSVYEIVTMTLRWQHSKPQRKHWGIDKFITQL